MPLFAFGDITYVVALLQMSPFPFTGVICFLFNQEVDPDKMWEMFSLYLDMSLLDDLAV